ncbi:fructose-bisphosphatase class III [Pelagicoccus enzymogenes]|uniref:fructose-bisphosphatase class III n=1 Tax=Pelagicoccus enzymogenes TaxID=2773457 RepID=UPI00280EA87A|nr:fructose-bisphosphatase class III [Pelagicoccus enzymogenes]MDQ8198593.1 fructose-bisphosphatase class III [Pelagicoccus enzymogenes]
MKTNTLSFKRPGADLSSLELLASKFPNVDAAIAEIARLSAVQTLPQGAIHIISDIHGEDKKLQHIINNASGTLRPLVEQLFGNTMTSENLSEFLKLTFYPAEVTAKLERELNDQTEIADFARRVLGPQFALLRHLMSNYSLRLATELLPDDYKDLLLEILHAPSNQAGNEFIEAIIVELLRQGRLLHLIHIIGRLIRNLAVDELIIGGDCWDRGPRGDRVVDYLRLQPNVSFIWGNHDAVWLGAALGNEALICTALRISLRYRRLSQLDEGYSVPLTPLEHLAHTVYGNDPAKHFMPKGSGMRPIELVARMQKAIAVMQFKLEGQMIERNPHWDLEHRRLMHRIDYEKGTVEIDGETYELRDKNLPTVNPERPYELSVEEQACLDRLKQSFLRSQKLREQMEFMVNHGSMYLKRGCCLIFHGCVPTSPSGEFLSFEVDGEPLSGKELFEGIEMVVRRSIERAEPNDVDFLWYLWCGPLSPLFGKERIATFERDFIADKKPHAEKKDPYFDLIHEAAFCDKVLQEFEADPEEGLIVNGHVPVKLEQGESPMKRSGKAITIDGAFSEAYGDYGYTLVLEPSRIVLAEHHHFDSVESAIKDGVDIVPKTQDIRVFKQIRRTADNERGQRIRYRIADLERLVDAYRNNRLLENGSDPSLLSFFQGISRTQR